MSFLLRTKPPEMKYILTILGRIAGPILAIISLAIRAAAQGDAPANGAATGGFEYLLLVLIIVATIAGVVIVKWWRRNRSEAHSFENRYQKDAYRSEELGLEVDRHIKRFRRRAEPTSPPPLEPVGRGADRRANRRRTVDPTPIEEDGDDMNLNSRGFQEKMKHLAFARLPIHSFIQLTKARGFEKLPFSSDPLLVNAVEQANEEFEEDQALRALAVKILAKFRARNSVESLSQLALYDLSANVRSKAVATLTDFDHESVFEGVLLACADPTREVRAAAARGLFRLSFDRAEAWKRIIDSEDEFRMRHAARAAIESGILQQSLERLIHDDMRIAYEAFALVALLIRSGETAPIFDALANHKDERVRLALLHVLKVVKDERSLAELEDLMRSNELPKELTEKVIETIKGIETVAA